MKESKFTKGKWETRCNNELKMEIICGKIRIARELYDDWNEIPTEELDANARLIAASPDMLKALKAVEVSLMEDEYYQHFKPLLKTVREAIYKAEGK